MSATMEWHQASTIAEMGNPFIDDTKDLFSLDTKVVMDASAVELLNKIRDAGGSHHQKICGG